MFFFIPNFSHLKSKLLAFMFSKDTRRPCLYCGKPQQEENQPGSVWLRWQKYKVYRHLRSCWLDQIFFCHNFRKLFFSFGAQLFTSTKTEFRQNINREIMHFIEFFPPKWDLRCCFTRQHQRTSGHRATWKLRWKSFFLVDVCLFLKRHKKIGEAGKGMVGNIDIKNIYTVIAKNSIQPEP